MTDEAKALHLLMARLAATEAQWQAEKERAEEAERGEREAWRQVDEVRVQRDEARAEVERLDHQRTVYASQRDSALAKVGALQAGRDEARAEVERLRAALDAERDWSRALGEDSRSQQKQLDAVCDAVGFYPRNDATDVAGLVRAALAASQAREKRLREALAKSINLTCNCARDPEFRALGHADFCDARAALAEVEP